VCRSIWQESKTFDLTRNAAQQRQTALEKALADRGLSLSIDKQEHGQRSLITFNTAFTEQLKFVILTSDNAAYIRVKLDESIRLLQPVFDSHTEKAMKIDHECAARKPIPYESRQQRLDRWTTKLNSTHESLLKSMWCLKFVHKFSSIEIIQREFSTANGAPKTQDLEWMNAGSRARYICGLWLAGLSQGVFRNISVSFVTTGVEAKEVVFHVSSDVLQDADAGLQDFESIAASKPTCDFCCKTINSLEQSMQVASLTATVDIGDISRLQKLLGVATLWNLTNDHIPLGKLLEAKDTPAEPAESDQKTRLVIYLPRCARTVHADCLAERFLLGKCFAAPPCPCCKQTLTPMFLMQIVPIDESVH
jgi:hypothetical protein